MATTTYFSWNKPTVGGSTDSWGGALNTIFDNIDKTLGNSFAALTVDIDGGTIDGTPIGATTPAAIDCTTMDATGNATVGGTLGVTGAVTFSSTLGVTGTTSLNGNVSLGNATGDTVGFYGAAGTTRAAHLADLSLSSNGYGTEYVDIQVAVNGILARLENLGINATS